MTVVSCPELRSIRMKSHSILFILIETFLSQLFASFEIAQGCCFWVHRRRSDLTELINVYYRVCGHLGVVSLILSKIDINRCSIQRVLGFNCFLTSSQFCHIAHDVLSDLSDVNMPFSDFMPDDVWEDDTLQQSFWVSLGFKLHLANFLFVSEKVLPKLKGRQLDTQSMLTQLSK